MTDGESESTDGFDQAVDGAQPSWLTLPRTGVAASPGLRAAIDSFGAGDRPAARAAAEWLRMEALDAAQITRTRVLIARRRVFAFYSLSSAQVALSQRDRRRLGMDPLHTPVRVPAALVGWIARDPQAQVDGEDVLLHAAATARRADALQATAVLVIDPYDEETAAMWRQRFGFRRSQDDPGGRRLWLPLP